MTKKEGKETCFFVVVFVFFKQRMPILLLFFLNDYSMFILFILFMAVLGLRFCVRALPNCGKRGPLLITVRGPPTTAASPAAEHMLQARRLSNRGSRAQLPRGTWDPPRPGLEPMSPAPAGRLSTTAPPGKPKRHVLMFLSAHTDILPLC